MTPSDMRPMVVPTEGPIGKTMFDVPGSEDLTLTILLSQENLQKAPAQSLLRIESTSDSRRYLAVVTAGPFAEPDGLRGDSSLLVAVATHNGPYMPPYHGRVEAKLLGEEVAGTLQPPRLRPLPNSPVYRVPDSEAAGLLKAAGDIRIGLAIGHEDLTVGIPSNLKSVLPRHLAILGTTGGGKSTTVAGLIRLAQEAGMAVIVLDVEGEYTRLHEPTTDAAMRTALRERGLEPGGVPLDAMTVYHLANRDCANPSHPNRRPFSVQFARISPYVVGEILNFSEAQDERFFKVYDIAKELLRELKIFPAKDNEVQERIALEVDEFQRGYPKITLPLLIDIVIACTHHIEDGSGNKPAKGGRGSKATVVDQLEATPKPRLNSRELSVPGASAALWKRVATAKLPGSVPSWRALQGRLGRLNRLGVFYIEGDETTAPPLRYKELLRPGNVSVIDLSDSGFNELNNLVISDLLFGLQEEQDKAYQAFEKGGQEQPPRVLIIIEEAHEFLSQERISKTKVLFEQVSRLARRGRKRWMSLAFVTQLPQHLPPQLLGLVNSFILHKITDGQIITTLRRSIHGIDESLWNRLSGLTPGQALVSFPHMTKPLLVSIDPTAAQLRMVD